MHKFIYLLFIFYFFFLDLRARPALLDFQVNPVKLETVDKGDSLDHLALLDKQDREVQLDHQAHPEHQDHKEAE